MGVANLDEETMGFFRNRSPEDPAVIKDAWLKDYAERVGGNTLRYYQLALGRIWDVPIMMTDDEAAKRLNLSAAEVQQIEDEAAAGYAEYRSSGGGGT